KEGSTEDAIDAWSRALALDPNDAEGQAALGTLRLELGLTATAIDPLRKAIELSPSDGEIAGKLGSALLSVGRADEALVELERAAALGLDARGFCDLGRARLSAGQHERAVSAFDDCLRRAPSDVAAMVGRGDALVALNRQGLAAESYRHAIAAAGNAV